jgi:hypothetical protein
MATIRHGYVHSFIDEVTTGTHDFDADEFKMALFDADATLTEDTTAYATTNEITGTGYTAGGATMVLATGYPTQDATTGRKSYRWDNVTWAAATFGARAGLVYNASKANRAVAVIDFGALRSVSADTFAVTFPTTLPAPLSLGV